MGPLTIVVTEHGASREATLRCHNPYVIGTGYLDGRASTSACVTALMSEPVQDWIERGIRPEGRACRTGLAEELSGSAPAPKGATVHVKGPWFGEQDRTLTVTDDCSAALWAYMTPLREPVADPLLVRWEQLEQ